MVLSDRTIRAEIDAGRIAIDPHDPALIQPSSVDVRVDRQFRVFHNARYPYIDVRRPMEELTELVEPPAGEAFILGRLGLLIHSTAGFVDAGFSGKLTLELSNVANLPITIYEGMPIGQVSFMRMDGPVERPYGSETTGSKYQGQDEPTPSRFHLNFDRAPGGEDTELARDA